MKFEKIQPDMTLYDVHNYIMGNTTMRSMGCWSVKILSIDSFRRTAQVSWNSNREETYHEHRLEKLRAKRPIMVKTAIGTERLLRRGETVDKHGKLIKKPDEVL